MSPFLAAVLRDARKRAGLTQWELAERAGVSRATIAEAELGADPRLSTLVRLQSALVCLGPRRLLSEAERGVPTTSRAAWRTLRELSGFVARSVVREVVVGPTGWTHHLEVASVRSLHGDATDPAVRRGLIRAVYRGSPAPLAAALEAAGGDIRAPLTFEDELARHDLSPDENGFRYSRSELCPRDPPSGAADRLSYTLGFPAERLELRARFAAADVPAGARYEAHPGGVAERAADSDIAAALRPGDLAVEPTRTAGSLAVVVPAPEMYVAHELRWSEEAEPPRRPRLATNAALREARERAGLSRRALAQAMGVSPTTIGNVERGLDPRRSTLVLALRELPGLLPEDVVPAPECDRLATPAEVWEHYRQLGGMEAEEESKEVIVAADGWAEATHVTLGLRTLVDRPEGLVIRYGASRIAGSAAPSAPDTIELVQASGDEEAGFRTRRHRSPDGQVIHELRFSREAARRGVGYRRRIERAHRFALPGAAPEAAPADGVDGLSFAAPFPVRQLRLAITFPEEAVPRPVHVHAWPALRAPELPGLELRERLHPADEKLQRIRRGRRVEIRVREPLIGIRYALTWRWR